jgi:hypothetical protein
MNTEKFIPMPLEQTITGTMALWFREHPNTFFTFPQIAESTGWGTVYTGDLMRVTIGNARKILRYQLHDTGALINIFHENGYVYYPQIASGDHISPDGYRPVPEFEGDAERATKMQDLFSCLRYATVTSNVQKAISVIGSMEYRYLTVYAEAFVRENSVNNKELIYDMDLKKACFKVEINMFKRSLEQLTGGMWTIKNDNTVSALEHTIV